MIIEYDKVQLPILPKQEGQYRFFYHFNKHTKKMTVHFQDECIPVDDIICYAPCETKWNDEQPFLVMRGWAFGVKIINNVAIIS